MLSVFAGFASVAGLSLLFGGFAVGRMAVVAPGQRPASAGWSPSSGASCRASAPALSPSSARPSPSAAAVVLARSEAPIADAEVEVDLPDDDRQAALMAVGAGLAFGVILICFSETTEAAGLWPPMIAHFVAIPTLTLIVVASGRSLRPPPEARRVMVASGFFDATAIALLVVALRQDLVSLVAPAASLYPAGTALLAALVLGEHLQRTQVAGPGGGDGRSRHARRRLTAPLRPG